MRVLGMVLVGTLCASAIGCTANQAVRNEIVAKSGSIADIYYQQALDNVAKQEKYRGSVPSWIRISGGNAQVVDTGSLSGSGDSLFRDGRTFDLTLGGSRGITQRWDAVVVDSKDAIIDLTKEFQEPLDAKGWATTDPKVPGGIEPDWVGQYGDQKVYVKKGRLPGLTTTVIEVLGIANAATASKSGLFGGLTESQLQRLQSLN
ncbi:MAG: hypothetical protein AAGF84_03860 [Planctomycetota bacterium]